MSRSVPWRRNCPDKVSSRIQRASRARIYLLRATGPTGFLVTAEGDDRKYKVFLGDPHSCTCSLFMKERDLCIHILWVLIKKFRVPKENAVIFQLGLVEREIGEVVRGLFTNTGSNKVSSGSTKLEETDSREQLSKKEIMEDDVCPICQEDMFGQKQPTTYCKYGCGNSIHIKCIKIWAEHQKSSGESIIKCPLCRVDFGSFEAIKTEYLKSSKTRRRLDVHVGAVCAQCGVSPITGKCYRCTVCSNYQLCRECFSSDPHPQHSFVVRQRPNQRWRPASKYQVIPPAAAADLQSREITEDDYTLLLQLDGPPLVQSSVPGRVLDAFPIERIATDNHRLITEDEKCGVCFQEFKLSQVVRRLPCKHEFHRDCIDSWLSSDHNTCPVDGQTVYSSLAGEDSTRRGSTAAVTMTNRQQAYPRGRKTVVKKVSLSQIKRQNKTSMDQEQRLPQNFSLHGLGLHQGQRNKEPSSDVFNGLDRTNSAPSVADQTVRQTESSSRHITFDTRLLGRAVISAENVMRYGRHSGDSRLRRCTASMARKRNETFGPKSLSLNDITLSGQRISAANCQSDHPIKNSLPKLEKSSWDSKTCDPNLITTPLSVASPDMNSYHIPVDI